MQLDEVRLQGHGPSALEFVTGFVHGTPLSHDLTQRGADLDRVAREACLPVARIAGTAPVTIDLAAIVITAVREDAC